MPNQVEPATLLQPWRETGDSSLQSILRTRATLWQKLEAFENDRNKITAKKFISDLSPARMKATPLAGDVTRRTCRVNHSQTHNQIVWLLAEYP